MNKSIENIDNLIKQIEDEMQALKHKIIGLRLAKDIIERNDAIAEQIRHGTTSL